ncbi:Penicillin-binding protein 1A (Includes: Penicillin-insensitive transglycosylase; Penicillin-sensitive transpeptidase) [Candidatus Terasakiella magnetica]|uniref:Penicillin-binding protein 1A n=2 Tax=Candidatus Terasakiella magnetica TaxID=1867952 RepID=A0A1C3RL93_9PROT|nr:penicillin-binding protein 1A [Candidatus Terasakiella magnetica]SCA58056.1 Penicillin-binding protein 1A (Includes: Penicillin-insensitive transglycosylase; Penicillin-sensitive transpeptidase) [Candidatus Terasakiella magnetica]
MLGFFLFLAFLGAGALLYGFYYYGKGLPDYTQLKDYEPPVMTRVHAGDGQLMAEYAIENRVFVPIKAIPQRVIRAFLAAEDKNFYHHSGIDPMGVGRAILINIKNVGKGRRLVGASTITQQVAKNFLLTNEVSYVRKIKEAILALRIEKAFEKDRILELYLNEIYLGYGSYGVAAAALNYFNKSLGELSIEEVAYLAALPKAPNNYHPIKKTKKAVERRNWVVDRMAIEGVITLGDAADAKNKPLKVASRAQTEFVKAPYFAEEVRRELVSMYGEDKLYKGGLSVHTTLDPTLQAIAQRQLQKGLETYDRRHGWRGPVAKIDNMLDWQTALGDVKSPKGAPADWTLAVVLKLHKAGVSLGLLDGSNAALPFNEMKWAREPLEDQKVGARLKQPSDALNKGDVVWVKPVVENSKGDKYQPNTYALRQIPKVQGGIVSLDPHTGRVLAMVGGYSYAHSQFNRVTQAKRQPGSAFKPFVYLSAFDEGYTPSTLILDAPFVLDQGPGQPKWRPDNYSKKFYGPSTMRLGIEKSRNLMTVRLAQTLGMDKVSAYAKRFDITPNLPEVLSMALGSGETKLMNLATAYGMLVNGGKRILPTLIDRIQDRNGVTQFKHETRECPNCLALNWTGDEIVPQIVDNRESVTSPESAYQIVSILEGVVQRGTGRRVRAVGKPLGGKTGTTNKSRDTWFMGFSPDLVTGVFVGMDTPTPLGRKETGSSVAAPIFRDFMKEALAGKPATPFRIPDGVRMVRVNARTGQDAQVGETNVIWEAFKQGTSPSQSNRVLEGQSDEIVSPGDVDTGGGLY